MTIDNSAFESMYWYRVERINNELKELGCTTGELRVEDLIPFDQFHPLSTVALDEAANQLGILPSSQVLDIGSGVGGPARYLAQQYQCLVTGVELHPQMCKAAIELTQQTRLSEQVNFYQGDITTIDLKGQSFDYWIAIGVFLHIPDRSTLFSRCFELLKPGGSGYIEDFFQRQTFTAAEKAQLTNTLACPYLPTRDRYLVDLAASGFVDLHFEDVTYLWQPWEIQRAIEFEQNKSRHLKVHGEQIVQTVSHFYRVIANLFEKGNIGGARIRCQRPID